MNGLGARDLLVELYRRKRIAGYHIVLAGDGSIAEAGVTPLLALQATSFEPRSGQRFEDFIRETVGSR